MPKAELETITGALDQAGVEVYRVDAQEVHIAERIRVHLMDSGVRVVASDSYRVRFTARAQRSDFPNLAEEDLFTRVRSLFAGPTAARGYREVDATSRNVTDPVDDARVLDVWHEVTYEKSTTDAALATEEVQWALALDKYVAG